MPLERRCALHTTLPTEHYASSQRTIHGAKLESMECVRHSRVAAPRGPGARSVQKRSPKGAGTRARLRSPHRALDAIEEVRERSERGPFLRVRLEERLHDLGLKLQEVLFAFRGREKLFPDRLEILVIRQALEAFRRHG